MQALPTDSVDATRHSTETDAVQSSLQAELVSLKLQIQALHETLGNLTHENDLLKRRLFGTKSERSRTSEMQLTLGELFDAQKALQKKLDEAVQKAADEAGGGDEPHAPGRRKTHGGGRPQLELSKLPRVVVEIPDPDLEATARRIGYDDSYLYLRQRGGWSVLVKRTIKYEVTGPSGPTVVAAPQPEMLFRKGLLHSSVVAHLLCARQLVDGVARRVTDGLDGGVREARGVMALTVSTEAEPSRWGSTPGHHCPRWRRSGSARRDVPHDRRDGGAAMM